MDMNRIGSIAFRLVAVFIILLSAVSARGQDVPLPCPGGMVDSTADIQYGLWATKDGGTLQLDECTYYVTQAIEARWNHHGTMQGQGKDLTFIEIFPGAKIDGVPIAAWDGLSFSTLFLFENPDSGNIKISDLSIVVTDPEPAGTQDDPPGRPGWWQEALYNLIVITGPNVDSRFERVSFRGAQGFFGGFNVAHASHIGNAPSPMQGSHTAIDCEFENTYVTDNPWGSLDIEFTGNTYTNTYYGPLVDECSNCSISVSRNLMIDVQWGVYFLNLWDSNVQVSDNEITGEGSVAVAARNLSGSTIEVAGNSVFGPSGVYVRQDWTVDEGSIFIFHDNAVSQRPSSYYAGFEIWDGSHESHFTIAHNLLHSEGAAFWGPIFTDGTRGAFIWGNTITGNGPAAMYLGSYWGDDSDMYVIDNDVLGFTPKMHKSLAGDVIPSHYWLGALTSYNTIIGQDAASDRVFDTGANNTVLGAMHIQQGKPDDHPGQSMFNETAAAKRVTFPPVD